MRPLVGCRIKVFRRAAVFFRRPQFRFARIHRRATQAQQLRHHLSQIVGIRRFDAQPQPGRIAVRPPNGKLLNLETAAEFDDRIEDALHDVRINEVPLRFHGFRERQFVCVAGVVMRLGVRQKDRQAHLARVSGPVAIGVEHALQVHFARPQFRIRNRHHGELAVRNRGHLAEIAAR